MNASAGSVDAPLPSLYPVLLAVPTAARQLTGRSKVAYLSRYARAALRLSASQSRIPIDTISKDTHGAPIPSGGTYWSLTHKPEYVGGVTAPFPIGLDIEKIKSVSPGLAAKTAAPAEWALSDEEPQKLFFRYWTAKEAVLKAAGRGLKGVSTCRIVKVLDKNRLLVIYDSRQWPVEHYYFDDHIASIVTGGIPVSWTLLHPASETDL